MSHKRNEREESTSNNDNRPRKKPSLRRIILNVMELCRWQHFLESALEPLIRQVVKEEMDRALRKSCIFGKWNLGKNLNLSESKSLQLKFSKKISLPVFTGTLIEGEGCTMMEVALVDVHTEEVVSSGLECSAKVEIVVLEGNFDGHGGRNWTHEEFINNIVRARERKNSLLNGEVIMTLKNGISLFGDVSFSDNSSWTRSRKFRLGARFVDSFDGIRVREAISEPFVVRDHRGELYKKHHPPSLSDEVWRLEKISKDGAFHKRLSKEKVNTVQDFLILFFSDPRRLQKILGGMSAKMWELTVDHAQSCPFDERLYFYNSSRSLPENGVVFNMIGQMMGMFSNDGVVFNMIGQMMGMFSNDHYVPADKLSESEKVNAHELVICAFENRDKILTFDSQFIPTFSCLPLIQPSSDVLPEDSDHHYLSTSNVVNSQLNPTSPGCVHSICLRGGLDCSVDCLHIDTMHSCYDECFGFPDSICDTNSVAQSCANDYLQYFETDSPNLEPTADLQSTRDVYIPYSAIPIVKTKWGWNVLFSIFRWWFSIKRIVARNKETTKSSLLGCSKAYL